MITRIKVFCSHLKKQNESEYVYFAAVASGSEENKSFAKAAPCAGIQLTIDNPSAHGLFKQGNEYYVDFNPV